MYEKAEVIIRLNNVEVQLALGHWLDDDAHQALNFIREKILNKTVRNTCKSPAGKKMVLCHLKKSNWACCRTGQVVRKKSDGGSSMPSP